MKFKHVRFGLALPTYAANSLGDKKAETYWGVYDFPLNDRLSWRFVVDTARKAEKLGYESIWTPDHFMLGKDGATFESLTTLSALSQITSRIKFGTWVLCNNYRNPALVAKMASTLGNISDGRFILGYGAGWYGAEYEAYGYRFPPPGERVEMMSEGLQVIRGMLENKKFTFNGKYYAVKEVVNAPKSRKQVPIIVGGWGKRVLSLAAEYAEGWDIGADPTEGQYAEKVSLIKSALSKAHKPYTKFTRSIHIHVLIGRNEAEVNEKKEKVLKVISTLESKVLYRPSADYKFEIDKTLIGTPDVIRKKLEAFARLGCQRFILMFMDYPKYDSPRLFASEFVD